jgi:uncharacterized protein
MAGPAWLPSPKARLLWTLDALLLWVPLLAAETLWLLLGADLSDPVTTLLLVVSVLVATAHVAVMPQWRYRVHRWEITDTAVHTRTGWFTQESRVAPLSRLQTIDTERGPAHRLLGLADVTITTASSAGAVKIVGLELARAEQAVADLTEIASRNQADAT